MGVLLGDLVSRMLSVSPRRRNGQRPNCCCRTAKEHRPMVSSTGALRLRRCHGPEIGIADHGEGRNWPAGEVFLATVTSPHTAHYLLAVPDAVLEGAALTAFLDRVAPFGCPPPPSLIRAYSLPDAPYPSILLKEHDDAPAGTGRRVPPLRRPRQAALAGGPAGDGPRLGSGLGVADGAGPAVCRSRRVGRSAGERQASPGRAWPMTIWGEDCCCWPTRISGTRGTP